MAFGYNTAATHHLVNYFRLFRRLEGSQKMRVQHTGVSGMLVCAHTTVDYYTQ